MPYSTRRVSLNLQSLGVQLPQSRGSHRSPPNPTPTSAGTSENPPPKRVKRSHTLETPASTSSVASGRLKARKSISSISEKPAALPDFTPPPSPGSVQVGKRVDTQDIKDDIVVAVIRQLEATGNRPHQIKDIAQILAGVLKVVQSSQNPVAIISSRLTNYLKKPWTALAPCPLAKEQVTIHPRRVYYFLTSMPRQEIPEYSKNPQPPRHMITPSVSSGTDSEQCSELFEREEMSPESEFDFPAPEELGVNVMSDIHFNDEEYDQPMEDIEETPPMIMQSNHPPLEHDEREFSRTAGAMRQRKESEQAESRRASRRPSSDMDEPTERDEHTDEPHPFPHINEEPESMDEDSHANTYNAASLLFGHQHHNNYQFSSSPMLKPQQQAGPGATFGMTPRKHVQTFSAPDSTFAWSDLKSPENVGLAELDDLLGEY